MVKQLRIPIYLYIYIPIYTHTLPCADLRWEKFPYIINKLNSFGLSDEELKI